MCDFIATVVKNVKNNNYKCSEKETVRCNDDLMDKLFESVKEYERVDWERVKDKYENILSLFIKYREDENDMKYLLETRFRQKSKR